MFILADFTCDYFETAEDKSACEKNIAAKNKTQMQTKQKNKKKNKNSKKKMLTTKCLEHKTLINRTVGMVPCSKGRILVMESLIKNYVKIPIDNNVKQKIKMNNVKILRRNPNCRRNG